MNYNFESTKEQEDGMRTINVNYNANETSFSLDFKFQTKDDKFSILFQKFKKFFLISVKAQKQPKNLKFNHYQAVLKYM
jgi:hypothetical protein